MVRGLAGDRNRLRARGGISGGRDSHINRRISTGSLAKRPSVLLSSASFEVSALVDAMFVC
jgi:hypothetical protein